MFLIRIERLKVGHVAQAAFFPSRHAENVILVRRAPPAAHGRRDQAAHQLQAAWLLASAQRQPYLPWDQQNFGGQNAAKRSRNCLGMIFLVVKYRLENNIFTFHIEHIRVLFLWCRTHTRSMSWGIEHMRVHWFWRRTHARSRVWGIEHICGLYRVKYYRTQKNTFRTHCVCSFSIEQKLYIIVL